MTALRTTVLIVFSLAALTICVYGQVGGQDFIRFDDEVYVTKNPNVRQGLTAESLRYAFTATEAGFWHPLTWLSLMVDRQLFGNRAGGYHVTNLLLHLASTLLLFFIFLRMTAQPWQSGFAAALFALHPLHVEPVAWIASRKDVLSALFWMLATGAYVLYAERPVLRRYLMVVLFFALGLMAKPMVITLPFVLILLDCWPLEGFRRREAGHKGQQARLPGPAGGSRAALLFLLMEKVPLLIMGLAAGIVTIAAEGSAGALAPMEGLPLGSRLANAVVSYGDYLLKLVWPLHLAVFYPFPARIPWSAVLMSGAALLTISLFVLWQAKKYPYLAVGWLWYLATLLPVSGIVQVGSHAMADRYTYIPLIGIFIMLGWGIPELMIFRRRKIVLAVAAFPVIIFLSVMSWRQTSFWQDSVTLFSHALSVTSGNYLAHNNLGAALMDQGEVEQALYHYRQALKAKPRYAVTLNNLGNAYVVRGDYAQARRYLEAALSIKPDYGQAHRNLADLLMRMGNAGEAILHYRRALLYIPDDPELHGNYGVALAYEGKIAPAIGHLRRALELKPDFTEAKSNLSKLLRNGPH